MRHADGLRDEAKVLDHLRRHANVDDFVLVHPGESHLGLEKGVLDKLRAISVLDDGGGGGESRVDVALAHLVGGNDVICPLHHGSAGRQRLFDTVNAGERLQIERDQFQRLFGDCRGVRSDQRQRLAVIAHALAHQNLLIGIQALAPRLAGNVRGRHAIGELPVGQHAGDAGESTGSRDIDAREKRARLGASQDFRVQHAR